MTGYFLGQSEVQKLFWGLLMYTNNFCFLSIAQFRRYHPISFFSTEGRRDGRTNLLIEAPTTELKNQHLHADNKHNIRKFPVSNILLVSSLVKIT